MHSWTWSDGPEFIAEVFLVQGWAKDVAKVNIEDLSTALGLWDNCTEYDIQINTLKKLREVRNFVAHNPKSEVSDDKLKTYFMVFGVLFHDADLKDFMDKNKCLQDLDEIKHKKDNRLDTLLSKVENMSDECVEVLRYSRRKSKIFYVSQNNYSNPLGFINYSFYRFVYVHAVFPIQKATRISTYQS